MNKWKDSGKNEKQFPVNYDRIKLTETDLVMVEWASA